MELKQQALALYKFVFYEDSADFAEVFTNKYFEKNCLYTLKDGKMVAMLYLLDCLVFDDEKTSGAKYLYAAATHPEYRKRGLMSNLMKKALAENEIIITKPANKELFPFYEKFGFTVCAFKDKKELKAMGSPITAEEYINYRDKLLGNVPHITLADEEFSLNGLQLYGNSDFVAALDPDDNSVKEYINKNENPLNDKTPFAMWNKKVQSERLYFGIAMD